MGILLQGIELPRLWGSYDFVSSVHAPVALAFFGHGPPIPGSPLEGMPRRKKRNLFYSSNPVPECIKREAIPSPNKISESILSLGGTVISLLSLFRDLALAPALTLALAPALAIAPGPAASLALAPALAVAPALPPPFALALVPALALAFALMFALALTPTLALAFALAAPSALTPDPPSCKLGFKWQG